MIKWETVKVGDILWDVHKRKMGNTRMTCWGSWPVQVVEINHEAGHAKAKWNGNTPRFYSRRQIEHLRRSPRKDSQ